MPDPWSEAVRIFALLMVAAAIAGLVTERLAVPPTIGLLALGLAAGLVVPAGTIVVTPDLVLAVLLPGLVFDAAFRTHVDPFRWARVRILFLAVPGVVVTALVVALVLALTTTLTFESGIIVGAMVAATDPAAVVATFRRVPAPARLRTLVEGESLFNDGTGLALFAVALRLPTQHPSLVAVVAQFLVALVASAAIGVAAAWLAVRLLHLTRDHLVEATITVAAAYGSYAVAGGLGQSGLLATATAGLLIGSRARGTALNATSQATLDAVWEAVAFVLTALTFLLVGVATPLPRLVGAATAILAGLLAVSVARVVVVYGLLGLGGRVAEAGRARGRHRGRAHAAGSGAAADLPVAWLHVLALAGMRGAVTVALAIALPLDIAARDTLQAVTFGIVLVTVIVLGLAAGPLVPRLLAAETPRAPRPGRPEPAAADPDLAETEAELSVESDVPAEEL
jgi:CPA1 family monovalent cation:H+ antiporter